MITYIALVYDERVDAAAPAPRRMVAAGRLGPGMATIIVTREIIDADVVDIAPQSRRAS